MASQAQIAAAMQQIRKNMMTDTPEEIAALDILEKEIKEMEQRIADAKADQADLIRKIAAKYAVGRSAGEGNGAGS